MSSPKELPVLRSTGRIFRRIPTMLLGYWSSQLRSRLEITMLLGIQFPLILITYVSVAISAYINLCLVGFQFSLAPYQWRRRRTSYLHSNIIVPVEWNVTMGFRTRFDPSSVFRHPIRGIHDRVMHYLFIDPSKDLALMVEVYLYYEFDTLMTCRVA